ncbi:hypothetical protein DM860_006382 [Cuscuta australis]|uniref:Uncharacterized protein n=1 Tax=Cuscuta australis TaxID=267555 RepID=A0A328D3B8_9ASTE|nr:hypothetical protein DM860_006382 [Cuscuta australis]
MHMEVMELSFQDIPSDPQGRRSPLLIYQEVLCGDYVYLAPLHRFDFDCEISIVKEGEAGSVGIGNVLIESQTLHVMLEMHQDQSRVGGYGASFPRHLFDQRDSSFNGAGESFCNFSFQRFYDPVDHCSSENRFQLIWLLIEVVHAVHRFDFDCEISIVNEGDAGSVALGGVGYMDQTTSLRPTMYHICCGIVHAKVSLDQCLPMLDIVSESNMKINMHMEVLELSFQDTLFDQRGRSLIMLFNSACDSSRSLARIKEEGKAN